MGVVGELTKPQQLLCTPYKQKKEAAMVVLEDRQKVCELSYGMRDSRCNSKLAYQ